MNEAADPLARILTPVPSAKPSAAKRIAEIRANMPQAADLILLGDSLATGWPPDLFGVAFPGRRVLNLGLPGDRIQNTLWRLDMIEVGHLRPRELVLLLGTNNLGDGDPPHAIADGMAAVLRRARDLWGNPRPITVTVPRRGTREGFREEERLALNARLSEKLNAFTCSVLVDADSALAEAAGEAPSLDHDLLHLSRAGYARLSAATNLVLA